MRSVCHLTLALSSRRGEIYGSASVLKERENTVGSASVLKERRNSLSNPVILSEAKYLIAVKM